MLIIIIFPFKCKLCSYLGPTLLSAIHICLFLLHILIILIIQYERFKYKTERYISYFQVDMVTLMSGLNLLYSDTSMTKVVTIWLK